MRLLIIIAVLGATLWAYSERMIPGLNQPSGAFADDGSAEIFLFTSAQCGKPCTSMTGELHSRRAKFTELEVSIQGADDPNTQLLHELGGRTLPFLVAGEHSSVVSNGPEVASVLAMAFGERYLSKQEKKLYQGHFNQYDEPIVVVYGADWCPYCEKLQADLADRDIDFVEIDVDKHRNKTGISKTMDIRGYPSTWYGYHRVKGTDIKAVKRTIKVTSY